MVLLFKNKNFQNEINIIIGKKLSIPSYGSKILPRTKLLDRLSAGKKHPLIVIQGAAASGKTSLACQWIEKDRLVAGWYNIDAPDNDLNTFFAYFRSLLEMVVPASAAGTGSSKERSDLPAGYGTMALILQKLEKLDRDIHLFFDNYHLIDSERVNETLCYFLERMPSRVHLVLISRYAIPFSISNFRIKNRMTEISSDDLKFSEKEISRFFSGIMSAQLPDEKVKEIGRYTAGWIGGIQLFRLYFEKRPDRISSFDVKEVIGREAVEYFAEEILAPQPVDIRNFLKKTVFLEWFDADLCGEIVGEAGIQGLLDNIFKNGLFLIPPDSEETCFRYYPIFSDAIRTLVMNSEPDSAIEVHRKAALWLSRNNYLSEAFHHAFKTGDFEFAADLIEDCCLSLFERNDTGAFLPWIAKLPQEVFNRRPLLRLSACILEIESLQLHDIEVVFLSICEDLEQALARYRGMKKTLCLDMLAYLRCLLPYYRDQVKAEKKLFFEIFSSNSLKDDLFSGIMKVNLARGYILQGELLLASETLAEASPMIFSSESAWGRTLWSKVASDVERFQGRLHRADAILNENALFLEKKGLSGIPPAAMGKLPAAWIRYFRNDLEEALRLGTAALDYMEKTRTVNFIIEGYILLLFVYAAMEDIENMDRCLRKLNEVSKATGNPNLIISVNACIAYPNIARARLERLERWSSRKKSPQDPPFSMTLLYEKMVEAGLLYRQGKHREAAGYLEVLRGDCVKRNMMLTVIDIDLMHSATLFALGEKNRATSVMDQALSFSEAEWYIRPFAAYAPIIAPILSEMSPTLPNKMNTSYLSAILKVCDVEKYCGGTPENGKDARDGSLTSREMEILRMMSDGFTNREIAEKAFVSIDTVKTHARHIFEKLNVKTRVRAIRKAEKMQLLSPPKNHTLV